MKSTSIDFLPRVGFGRAAPVFWELRFFSSKITILSALGNEAVMGQKTPNFNRFFENLCPQGFFLNFLCGRLIQR
jgi:hypothetical protein